jgi:hypothetical protein
VLAQEAADTYRGYQALFGQAAETFPGLDAVAAQVAERADVWRALLALQQHALDWTSGTVLAEDGTVRPARLVVGGQTRRPLMHQSTRQVVLPRCTSCAPCLIASALGRAPPAWAVTAMLFGGPIGLW